MRLPLAPVLLRMMPLAGSAAAVLLPEEMLLKISPPAPMVVLATFKPVTLAALMVLSGAVPLALGSVTLTVPPLVAVNPAFAPLRFTPPVKFIVVPVLVSRKIPEPVLVMRPEKETVPPVLFWMLTAREVELVIVPA